MPPQLTLYGFYKSSCSTRLRIALALKKIDYASVYVDYAAKEHREPAYAAINPNKSLPTLAAQESEDADPVYIVQSVAALEYLEEAFPDNAVPLLPKSLAGRARVRSLVEVIVADLQPRQGGLTLEWLGRQFGAATEAQVKWAHDWCVRELGAYEKLAVAGGAGKFSVGDAVTLADVVLVPAIQNAVERWGVDLDREFPTLARIYANLNALPEVHAAHWQRQPDTPEHLQA